MKIQRNPLKNKTINNNPTKLKINPKLIKKFAYSSLRSADSIKNKTARKINNTKLSFIYMELNKTIKINNYNNKSTKQINSKNSINSLDKKYIIKRNNKKYSFLHNTFLAKSLNIERMNFETNENNTINNSIKNINLNEYFFKGKKNAPLSKEDNKMQKFFYSIDAPKKPNNIFSLMKTKLNIKYIRQNPYFKDLNLRPSSEKTWLFAYKKKKPFIISRNRNFLENKSFIPKINILKNVNKKNLIHKLKNYNYFNFEENKKDSNNYILDNNTLNNNLYKTNIKNEKEKKKNEMIYSYNFINKIDNSENKINNKKYKLIKSSYNSRVNNKQNKNDYSDNNKNKKNIFRLKSCKNDKRKIIINKNRKNYLKNNKDKNNFIDELAWSNMSFSDDIENENFVSINPIYS
jgi:hypothetical protein